MSRVDQLRALVDERWPDRAAIEQERPDPAALQAQRRQDLITAMSRRPKECDA
ncbi:hypothetical protein [Polymorphospora rubra]|uniref:Uncharacterized protein n=1 Tax=Polymorphospora rubra TaxID=338584 RepID=A0A810MT38_9ACTN|nr:hypothetical protein [Polymorphospora rubra]BCJ64122.1 hypothetical protein Prubr_11430 [Polymorphospora rubra]